MSAAIEPKTMPARDIQLGDTVNGVKVYNLDDCDAYPWTHFHVNGSHCFDSRFDVKVVRPLTAVSE